MKHSTWIYPFLYAGFTLLALYKSIVGEFGEAAMHSGIALAFDPFDPTVSWKNRPLWQRTWLVIHLALCAAAFGFEVGTNDSVSKGLSDGFTGKIAHLINFFNVNFGSCIPILLIRPIH